MIIPPGGWTVEWPGRALAAPDKIFISWSKGGGRFWAVDCVTQKVVQILGTTPIDLSCSHWVALADKEVEVYFFYRPKRRFCRRLRRDPAETRTLESRSNHLRCFRKLVHAQRNQ